MKVYIALEDVDIVGDFSNDRGEDYDTDILGVFADMNDAKKFINSMPDKLNPDRHIIEKRIEHDGWLITLKCQGDEMFTDLRLRYRVVEEEVQ